MGQDHSEIHAHLASSTASQPELGPLRCCKAVSNLQQDLHGNRAFDSVISRVTRSYAHQVWQGFTKDHKRLKLAVPD